MPCPNVFVQDVPTFVARKGVELRDYLDQREAAVIDAEHCVRVNYEAYFFGSAWTRERFRQDVVLYCGLLTDPVSRERFRPTDDSPRRRYEGVTYYFQSPENLAVFKNDPETYRTPGWKM